MIKKLLMDMFAAAFSAVDPYQSVMKALRLEENVLSAGGCMYSLDSINRVIVVGAGKATAEMALAVEDRLGGKIRYEGVVVVKYGRAAKLRNIEQVEAAHPIPDSAGIHGTRKVLELVQTADRKTLVICLLSGGASALLVDPLPGISLEDKQKSTDLLLRTGASVYEMNTVLKHLSGVKGGRLALAAYPASVLTLTLSDIIGDRMDVIASGPMAPGNSTFCDAARVIRKFNLEHKLPREVVSLIERGIRGQEPETARSTEACFSRTKNIIVGGIAQALSAAGNKARVSGYRADIMINEMRGPVRQTAGVLAKKALRIRDNLSSGERRCLLFGGERMDGNGRDCRSQELALAFAHEIAGIPGITLLSAGAQGTTGSTEAAGGVVDGTTTSSARELGIHSQRYLDNKEAHRFFKKLESAHGDNHCTIACPTGANAIDLQIILVDG